MKMFIAFGMHLWVRGVMLSLCRILVETTLNGLVFTYCLPHPLFGS